ncbi:MAG: hypothetical protein HY980_01820 [Candidatus Magasanikbacteria bacterium]|nr:hypothetical protein [Candidatus Magasanikbacteria bacterium]
MGNRKRYSIIVTICLLLFFGFVDNVDAFEWANDYRCVCNYKYSDGCSSDDQEKVELGASWSANGQNGTFMTNSQCETLLESAVKNGKVCTYSCFLERKIIEVIVDPNTGLESQVPGWKEWYDLKWKTDKGTKDNPFAVTEGSIVKEEIEADAEGTKKEVKIDCLNCGELGMNVENKNGSGKADVIWDTSAVGDLYTKIYILKVKAVVENTEPGSPTLDGSFYFSVTGVSPVQTTSTVDAWIKGQYGVPEGYVGALPPCAFSGSCRNVNDLLQLIINFASGMFFVLGTFAFAFFVYGGFKMIVSMGSPEKVKSGRDTMIAAALGLVVAIAAYAAIKLLLELLGVGEDFMAIK